MTEVTPGNRFVAYAQDLMLGCEQLICVALPY